MTTDEISDLSALMVTAADPAEVERVATAEFAQRHSAEQYRRCFGRLYPAWRGFNDSYFDGRLAVPHIGIGLTSPRRFCETRLTTDYGGRINIVLAERVAFGRDRRLVRTDDPDAPGLRRFLDDLLLAGTVKQYVLEVVGTDEDGWGGYGPRFAAEATRIGERLGLPSVEPRRRGFRGAGLPVAAFWPWAFRPDGYYLGAVRLGHLKVAGLSADRRQPPRAVVPGLFEYFLYLLVSGRVARLTEILGREVDAALEARSPAVAAAERGPVDPHGRSLPVPVIDPDWVAWSGGCVRAIAEGIRTQRRFDVMPILADALENAGCEDDTLLGHCRQPAQHTATCWALRLLTEPATT